jgi:hypothetical protein
MSVKLGEDTSVNGNLDVSGDTSTGGSLDVGSSVTVGGTVTSTGQMNAPAFHQTSDYRLKSNVAPILQALSLVLKLKPYEFDMGDKHKAGFFAHELQNLKPHLADGEKDGEFYQTVDYTQLIPYLSGAIIEQQKLIELLQSQINNLENQLRLLDTKNSFYR